MSFLSGLKKVGSWITGTGFSANLAKTAILGYTIYRLNRNLNKANNPNANIDEGVRLQINPSAENKIPVVYGTAFLSGIVTDAEMSNNNKTMHFCITISEKTGVVFSTNQASTTTFRTVYWNDQRIIFKSDGVTVDYTQDRQGVIDRSLESRVRIYCYDGGSNQPRAVQGAGSSGLVNADTLFSAWGSSTHQMNNLVFAVVRVDYDRDRGVTGLGDVKFQIENSMTKPGDCLFDYFTNGVYGAGVPNTEIDTSTLTALNTYSDQSVTYTDQTLGANQVLAARYRINGVLNTSQSVLENLENLASSAASWLSYDVQKGQWSLVINRADTAVAAFNDSTIIGSISINGTGIDDLYNRVKADFPNRDIRDAADFITIALPSNERNSNEYENTLNVAYDLINEPVQAEILGFIELKQSRVDLVIRFTTDYSYTVLTAGDLITVTNARLAWTNKIFRIMAINEKQDESGQLLVDITALEYDTGVYSLADLFRFTRSDQNGIITIGSIGIPGTPVVSKIEQDSRPRIIATTTSPSGIVERMEFWRTTDVSLSEAQRNYTLIGSVVPIGGGTFGIGETVSFEYDGQEAGNFLIKTRGLNTITTGPYSEASGIVEFQPQQVPDQIGPNTSLGGLVGALGALELLNLVDRLMKNESGQGGLFDKIFKVFEDVTGVDLVGQAENDELVVRSEVIVKENDIVVTTGLSELIFIGDNISVNPLEGEPVGTGKVTVEILIDQELIDYINDLKSRDSVQDYYADADNPVCGTSPIAIGYVPISFLPTEKNCSSDIKYFASFFSPNYSLATINSPSWPPMYIKNNTSTSNNYKLQLTTTAGLIGYRTPFSGTTSPRPTTVSGGTKETSDFGPPVFWASSSQTITIAGNYDSINYVLQGNGLTWRSLPLGVNSSTSVPPNAVVTFRVLIDDIEQPTKTININYTSNSQLVVNPYNY
jgi:hypothetical protein